MRILITAIALAACAKPASPPAVVARTSTPTLDVAGFEPPFEAVPIARVFIAEHHIAKIWAHEVDAIDVPAIILSSELTDYDASGAPVRRSIRDHDHHDDLSVVEHTTYVHGEPPAPLQSSTKESVAVLDSSGRVTKLESRTASSSVVETYAYNAAGQLTRTLHTTHSDDDPAAEEDEELRSYDPGGRLIHLTRGKPGGAPFEMLDFSYDNAGRMAEWHGAKPGYGDDRYAFSYDSAGQLAQLRFRESGHDIYLRTYAYDRDGFLISVDTKSFVPAMASGKTIMSYELVGGATRSPIAAALPPSPGQLIASSGSGLGEPIVIAPIESPAAADTCHLTSCDRRAVSPDRRWLALVGYVSTGDGPEAMDYGMVELVDQRSRAHRTWKATDHAQTIAFSADSSRFAVGGSSIRIWTAAIPSLVVATVPIEPGSTSYLAFADGDRALITATEQAGLQIWRLEPAPVAQTLRAADADLVTAADTSGDVLVTGQASGMIRVWSLATGKELGRARRRASPVTAVSVSRDASEVVTRDDSTTLRWSLAKLH